MALGSRLAAVQDKVLAALQVQPALSGIQVTKGHPGQHLKREAIWIDRLHFEERAVSLRATNHKRDQEVTVEIVVRVSKQGNDPGDTRARAYSLADEVEEALRANPTLSGEAFYGGVSGGEVDSFTDTDGRVCAVVLEATYRTRKG